MTDETIKSEGSVSLIRDNEDGSSDYQFNFPPEALAALTRLGILTAIQSGIAEARHLNPDEGEEAMTDEELKQAIEELNDTETEQDIAIAEKNIALMRDGELQVCVKEFFEKYLNYAEESDGGKMFNPIVVSCCRVMMTEPLNNLLARMAELSGAKPKESYD